MLVFGSVDPDSNLVEHYNRVLIVCLFVVVLNRIGARIQSPNCSGVCGIVVCDPNLLVHDCGVSDCGVPPQSAEHDPNLVVRDCRVPRL